MTGAAMDASSDLAPALAGLTGALVLLGALLAFVGALGLLRLPTFYERVHAPTLGTTLGTGLVLLACLVLSCAQATRPVLHVLAIAVFMTITPPVTTSLLMRAALLRASASNDRSSADATTRDGSSSAS